MPKKRFNDRDTPMDLCQLMERAGGKDNDSCLFFFKFDDPLIKEMVFNALSSECECCFDGGYND